MLGLIFNALITIVYGIFVGQGVGPDGIAAVNIIAPLLISFNYWAMSYDRVKAAFALSLKVAALCGVVVFVSIAFGAKALVPMFHAIPAVFPQWGIWAAIPASEALTLNTIVIDYCRVRHRRL